LLKLNQQRKDLLATLINQLWRLISGPILLLLIPLFLSPEQQGYWYLFGSISALSTFADMGFSNIVLQFSAHEYAFLKFNEAGLLEGEELYLKRLGSLLRFVIKWISTISIIAFPIIFIVGILFFLRDKVFLIYITPWIIFSLGSLINFFNNSILSFIEGLNKIEIIQKIRFIVAIIYSGVIIVILISGGNIFALAFGLFISASSIFIFIFNNFHKIIKQLLDVSKNFIFNWRKDIMPLFAKYAVSFSSGYFIFQIYTPLMHYFHGPVYSGKVGITLSLVTAVFNMSNIWMYTITPKINMLISQKSWQELDALFKKRLVCSLGTYILIIAGLSLFIIFFRNFWIIPRIIFRFLSVTPLVMLFACYFIQILINGWALYLRGHKQEPFVIPSLLSAIWTAIGTFLAGRYLSNTWFFIGFASGYVWGTPLCGIIYNRLKREWHG
jgi:O-antigen/teichoic acid export membrane protein